MGMKLETQVTETRQIEAVTIRILEPEKDVTVEVYYRNRSDMTPFFVMKDSKSEIGFEAVEQATKAILNAIGITVTEK